VLNAQILSGNRTANLRLAVRLVTAGGRAMYYRRKILPALIEVFGGSLPSTDCEKLLFNFCQQTGKNHYDFFPYKYGPFSFLSYYDKRRMIDLGLLKQADDFQLSTKHSYLNELTPADKTFSRLASSSCCRSWTSPSTSMTSADLSKIPCDLYGVTVKVNDETLNTRTSMQVQV